MRTYALALAALLPFAAEADSSFGQDCCGTFTPESSVPFPAVGQEFFLFYRPTGEQYCFPSNYPCSYLTVDAETNASSVVVHNDEEALGVLTNGDFWAIVTTRPRTTSSTGSWLPATVSWGSGVEVAAKIAAPAYPCDLDVRMWAHRGQTWYKYVDYSGLNYGFGLRPDGTPYYPEEPELWNIKVGRECPPDPRTMYPFSHTIRIRPYRSNYRYFHAVKMDPMLFSVSDKPACPVADSPGFKIVDVTVDKDGASVSFVTHEQPPYDVAVYRMCDIRRDRRSPIAHVVTSNRFATVSGSFAGEPVFVQVGSNLGIGSDITREENDEYADTVRRSVRGGCGECPRDAGDIPFVQTGDYEWSGYVDEPSDVLAVSFCAEVAVPHSGKASPVYVVVGEDRGIRRSIPWPTDTIPEVREVSGQAVTNWCVVPVSMPASETFRFATGAGSGMPGYRITFNEKNLTIAISKAMSAMPDCSEPWIVERKVIPLSANGRKEVFGSDWTGVPGKMVDTNAVPWRIRTAN